MDCLKQVSVDNNNKNNVIDTESVLNQLMRNVHITQSKRQQIIKNHHKSTTFSQAHYHLKTVNINDKENQSYTQTTNNKEDIKDPTTGVIKHGNYLKNYKNVQKSHKTDTINKSHHHPQSLLPSQCSVSSQSYLNIQEQYVYPSSIIVYNKNAQISQDNPSRNELNNCSIQLSQSVQESQEMLLHHSVSSKFLQSPTLSLGLIESKITKKSTLSHVGNIQNIQNTKENMQNLKNNKCQQNMNGENKMNQDGKILNQMKGKYNKKQYKKMVNKQSSIQNLIFFSNHDDDIPQIKSIQTQQNNQKLREKHIKLKEKINNLIKKQQSPLELQPNSHIPLIINDKDLNNEIISSYQMQIEYLRKINLIQSMEIQKLRKLVRLSAKENLSNSNINLVVNENNKDKDKDFRSKKIVVDNNISRPQQLHMLDSNIKTNNQINTTSRNHNHNQFLIIDSHSQIPFQQQNTHNNKCISLTTNTKITSNNSVHSIDQTQDLFQKYIKNNHHYHHKHEHKPSKKTLSKQVNNKSIPFNQSMRNSLLNSKSIRDNNNKHRVSLNEMDINSTLSFNNKHNLSCNNQSTCKKLKSNKKSQKLGSSSCQRQVMSLTKLIRNKQDKQNKQNMESKTLSIKKKDYNNKGKKKKAICSVDLLDSIKKQLYNQERRK